MLPPMSEPTPMTEQAAARTLPSPPAQEKTWKNPTGLWCRSSSKAGEPHSEDGGLKTKRGGGHLGFRDSWGIAGECGPKGFSC